MLRIGQRCTCPGFLQTSCLIAGEDFNTRGEKCLLWLCWPLPLHAPVCEEEDAPPSRVPVGEVIGQLDDFSDGFRVALGDAADVQLAVAFLLHLGDHPLEGGAPPDGEENLGGDPVGDAF